MAKQTLGEKLQAKINLIKADIETKKADLTTAEDNFKKYKDNKSVVDALLALNDEVVKVPRTPKLDAEGNPIRVGRKPKVIVPPAK